MECRKWEDSTQERVRGVLNDGEGKSQMTIMPEALRATRTDRSSMDFVKKMKLLESLMYLSMYLGDLDNWQKGWD